MDDLITLQPEGNGNPAWELLAQVSRKMEPHIDWEGIDDGVRDTALLVRISKTDGFVTVNTNALLSEIESYTVDEDVEKVRMIGVGTIPGAVSTGNIPVFCIMAGSWISSVPIRIV